MLKRSQITYPNGFGFSVRVVDEGIIEVVGVALGLTGYVGRSFTNRYKYTYTRSRKEADGYYVRGEHTYPDLKAAMIGLTDVLKEELDRYLAKTEAEKKKEIIDEVTKYVDGITKD